MIDRRSEVLLIDHVEADHHVSEVGSIDACVELSLNMVFSKNLEATSNDFHLKEGVGLLDLLLHSVEDGKFFFQGQGAVFVEDHSKDMLPLGHCNCLFDKALTDHH